MALCTKNDCIVCTHLTIDFVQTGSRDYILVITMWRPRGSPIIRILNLHISNIINHKAII